MGRKEGEDRVLILRPTRRIDLYYFFDMENEKKENECIWGRIKYACTTAVAYLAFVKDHVRLWYHRRLAEGGRWAYSGIIVLTVVAVLLVAVSLLFRYGAFCASQWVNVPDYMEGKFPPDNVLDAAGYLLFTNGGQNLFDGAHWWGFVITCLGILLVAFFTSKVTSRLERKAQRYLKGETWYRMWNHIVVFGVSDYLYSIIEQKTTVVKAGKTYPKKQKFLIVTTQDVEMVRREVFSFLQKGVNPKDFVFFFGDRTSNTDISKLSLRWAKEVFIIGDSKESDDIESYRDANNMDCIKAIYDYFKAVLPKPESKPSDKTIEVDGLKTVHIPILSDGKRLKGEDIEAVVRSTRCSYHKPLRCHVMFEYQTTFAAFQFCDIPQKYKDYVDFLPFNYYDLWARKVIVGGEANGYKYLDAIPGTEGKYISKDSEKTVHLIILGMTKMGVAMALQAAHICHFPNFVSNSLTSSGKRTRITFVDSNADLEMDFFKGRLPSMMHETRSRFLDFIEGDDFDQLKLNPEYNWQGDEKGWYDIEWEFIKGRVESDSVRSHLESAAVDPKHIVTVAVCLPKSHQSIAAAMYLPEIVFSNCLQVLAFQRRSGTILDNLSGKDLLPDEKKNLRYRIIHPFGMFAEGYDESIDDDFRARLVSYVYDSPYAIKGARKGSCRVWDSELEQDLAIPSLEVECWDECDTKFVRYSSDIGYYDWPLGNDEKRVLYRRYADYNAIWRKKGVNDKMSSMFNANSIGAKLRGIGLSEETVTNRPLTAEEIDILARVEHNRWNLEKFMTGFRTLSEKEMTDINAYEKGSKDWKKYRKIKKEWPDRAHLDICSVEELERRELPDTIAFDKYLSEAIPFIIREEKKAGEKKKQK